MLRGPREGGGGEGGYGLVKQDPSDGHADHHSDEMQPNLREDCSMEELELAMSGAMMQLHLFLYFYKSQNHIANALYTLFLSPPGHD